MSELRIPCSLQRIGLALAIGLLVGSTAAAQGGYNPTESLGFSPSDKSAAEWLPEPYPVLNASADAEADMTKYTEHVRGTDLTFDMVAIPSGKFLLGSPDDEEDRADDEGPQVEVAIRPFWMGKCEVTWNEFKMWSESLDVQLRAFKRHAATTEDDWLADAVSRPTPPYSDMSFEMGQDGYPAICMTQHAAKSYCMWLCAKTGRYYRLPTEAEWEYACRAGTTTAYSFGDDPDDLDDYAWSFDNCPDGYAKVGKKKPNPWGLHDMHGNVAEWCLDAYAEDGYQKRADGLLKMSFPVPTEEYFRVFRGGHWDDDPENLRSAARSASDSDLKQQDPQIPQSIWYLTDALHLGFRVVRPLETPGVEEAKLYEPDAEWEAEYVRAQGGKH